MKRSVVETILGAAVLVIAGVFLLFGYKVGNQGTPDGYNISADFAGIGGLQTGDEVQISGVKVGSVTGVDLVPESFLARVHMNVDSSITLPTDTAALISSESLLGGKYLLLEPGAEEESIPPGGQVQFTQAPQNLEQLLGQFIFSMSDSDKKGQSDETAAAPAPAPVLQNAPAATEQEQEPAHP
jgi:phospholipid/cholesterol/gamma-HCH transport system substrate-binding protein